MSRVAPDQLGAMHDPHNATSQGTSFSVRSRPALLQQDCGRSTEGALVAVAHHCGWSTTGSIPPVPAPLAAGPGEDLASASQGCSRGLLA
eukprot:1606662-Alexandrium_andersonii.AAC.1